MLQHRLLKWQDNSWICSSGGCQRWWLWIWWQGSALSTWAGDFSPLSSSPCCTHPTHVIHHHTPVQSLYNLLEKNSNAGVIKDNEPLISTGKHNWKHFISIAFLVELISRKHKDSQRYYHVCLAQSTLTEQVCNYYLCWLAPSISTTKEINSTFQMIPSDVATLGLLPTCCGDAWAAGKVQHHPSSTSTRLPEEAMLERNVHGPPAPEFLNLPLIQCSDVCQLLEEALFRRSVKTLAVASVVFLIPD